MAHAAQITALKRKRASIKASCTRVKTYVESLAQWTPEAIANLEERKEKLSSNWTEYNGLQFELEGLAEGEEGDRDEFEELFFGVTATVRRVIENFNRASPVDREATPTAASPVEMGFSACSVRLPKLDLPKFSGKYEEWFPFYDMFNSIINGNRSLTGSQKFQYLRASVRGEALDIIKSLELNDDNFLVAWNSLKQRYDNKRATVQTHLRAIFEMNNMAKENAGELRRMTDNAIKHIHALAALQCPTEHWDSLLIYLISSKFDNITTREWQASLTGTELPTFKQFTEFLVHRCQVLESLNRGNSVAQYTGKRIASHAVTASPSCGYCSGEHYIYYCRDFIKLPVSRRLAEIRKRKLCTNCLRANNHSSGKCKSGSCKVCGMKHNSLIHMPAKSDEFSEKARSENKQSPETTKETIAMVQSSAVYNAQILLSTAIVYITDANKVKQSCRVLLDRGSQANFITRACAERLGMKTTSSNIKITGINGMTSDANEILKIKLGSRLNGFSAVLECIVTDRIIERIPASPINREEVRIPSNIQLADPEFHKRSDIDVLIGAGLFWQLLCVGRLRASQAHSTLQKTMFGWIVAGQLRDDAQTRFVREVGAFHVSVTEGKLHNQLSKFWSIEEGFRPTDSYSGVERYCEQHFRETTRRNSEGRVIVTLPVKERELKELGETRDIAMRRFYGLEKRLNRDINLKLQYVSFMREYLSLGHMKLINEKEDNNKNAVACYLPHHCVLKPFNETTKLRVVFDASCESSTGVSLNDVLMVGPTVQQDLFSIILRFRTFRFVLCADITKMYRQILIDPEQTRLQRIFWREQENASVQTFELTTVTYGTASASYLATRTLQFLADIYAKEFSMGSRHITRDFYVDDLLTGANTIEEALKLRGEVIEILRRGGFQLSKWSSNEKALICDVQNRQNTEIQIDKDSASRILGVLWNPSVDNFRIRIELPDDSYKITKRIILSEISKLFDPLGLIGPVIIIPKMLLQEIWQLKLQWDETVPLEMHTRWVAFREQLSELKKLRVPRFVGVPGENYHIHGFCDASQHAYGACLYIQRKINNNEFRVDLLCSKTRVAPIRAVSIPRLELCAALLLAQLWDRVRSSIEMNNVRHFLWSDSTIALQWISSCSRRWSVFVANRVGEIQRLTSGSDWRHVPTNENPADLLSRGIHPHDIGGSVLWWRGPAFLKNSEESWPGSSTYVPESEMPERRRIVAAVARVATANIFLEVINKHSRLDKLCRVVAYCRRFIKPHDRSNGERAVSISCVEVSAALDSLCGIVQRSSFAGEIEQIKKGTFLSSANALRSLSPFLDDRGLIRVGGRLDNSQMIYGTRHPILLPKNHRLTKLVIEREHIRNLHAGLQGTMAAVRQNFWPLSLRTTARKIIRQCLVCFKCRPVMSEAKMGALPAPRVTPSRPFSNCGVDYAGPLIIREGKRRNARNSKAYACVFVCFATKAIHIEVVSDLTTEAFIAALKRFISRRGCPVFIFSDNGTNFKGASRQLAELYDFQRKNENREKINQFCCDSGITWQFIPPNAPHFGGLWESAVKSAKNHLRRIVGESHLTFEELQTVLCEIEAVLNSRPLTSLSSDPNDFAYLTPGHFLIGDIIRSFPCHDLTDVNQGRLIRWQRVEQLRQHFWSRWNREYLSQLQQRNKWPSNRGEQLEAGKMVLINQQGLAPLQWMLGRIKEIHPGADGVARSATVVTAKGSIVRPLTKLAIIPAKDE